MSVHLRSNFSDLFDSRLANLDAIYVQSKDLDESKAPWQKLFKIKRSTRQFENITGTTGFPQFSSVGEAAEVPLISMAQLFDKKFTHTKYASAWSVSEEMEDDDQDELIASGARAFVRAFRWTKEVNMANVFNNGDSSSELAADGSNVFATHTLYYGGTLANLATTDFGVSAAQTMFNYFATMVDDRGQVISLTPKYIFANPAMKWVVEETMGSEKKPFSTTNEKNQLAEEDFSTFYWPYLTDTDAWYVACDPADVNGFGGRLYNRQDFTVSTDFDIRNGVMISMGRGRWSRGVVDFRQYYKSTGA